ncbi:MAG: cell division protein SepF, partial [Halobacteriaceae archaeon]
MGFMNRILGDANRSTEDYVELDLDDVQAGASNAAMQVFIAEIGGQQEVMDIKDAVYDGDMVIADITTLRTKDRQTEHVIDELRQVAREVDGDIVQKGDD